MRLTAGASSSLRAVLAGPARPATWLGATPSALYLQIDGEPGVLALLAHDAVRLPCALLLPTTRAELPLTSLAPPCIAPPGTCPPGTDAARELLVGEPVVGDGGLAWTGPAGPVVVRAVREWAPPAVRRGAVAASALAAARQVLPLPAAAGIDGDCLPLLAADPPAAVARLLGYGPGLTPAGDDVLAGFLVGAAAFGLDARRMCAAIAALAPARTTALSAALLWHAARGESIDEVAAVAAALTRHGLPGAGRTGAGRTGPGQTGPGQTGLGQTGPGLTNHGLPGPGFSEHNPAQGGRTRHQELELALGRLLAVGHTSGAALAVGLATAAAAAANVIAGTPLTLYQQQGSSHAVTRLPTAPEAA